MPWCASCRALLAAPPLGLVELPVATAPPVRAAARYDGAARGLLLAWKERGRHDLSPLLADALRRAGAAALDAAADAGVMDAGLVDGGLVNRGPTGAAGGPLALVPAPSTRAAVRARGDDLVADLARRWSTSLARGGRAAPVRRVLAMRRGAGDQVGRTAAQRTAARRGALVVRAAPPRRCLLVDDVVTTGSTLAEAARVLALAGCRVEGAVVVLAAPPPGAGRRRSGRTGPGGGRLEAGAPTS
ncbi:ComF family protein [uncultured Pseudokineococcus sp.]|uniref:ComF family protein n=1 Tax=uncultured Pseudokineococcus sp. TaxID=1642928 RepID=UPI00263A389A|nr:phosphoribosyltransferase family protein [uncultured Pseudokineococcus sp.]